MGLACSLHNDFLLFLTFFAIVLILGDQFEELNECDYFFLFATVLRLPLRVRELFLVRCPRNGKPLR